MTNEYLIPALWDAIQVVDDADLVTLRNMIDDYGDYLLGYAFVQSAGHARRGHYEKHVPGASYIPCNRPSRDANGSDAAGGSAFERDAADAPIDYLTVDDVLWTPYASSSTTSIENLSGGLDAGSDAHTPSAALPLAWAWAVERDSTKKAALADYLQRVLRMFHANKDGRGGDTAYAARCGTWSGTYGNAPKRAFNWQRAAGVSWAWIMRNPTLVPGEHRADEPAGVPAH
jgi:hypothetical protein